MSSRRHPMTPSSATARRASRVRTRRRRDNAGAASGRTSPTARALAAGLWRLQAAQAQPGRRASHLCHGDKRQTKDHHHHHLSSVGSQCQCSRSRHGNGILHKMEACTKSKWDAASNHLGLLHHPAAISLQLEKAPGQIGELQDERRVMRKRLVERFLAEEKAAWKSRMRDKARHAVAVAVAALKEELSMERQHRRQLEAANAKLLREVAEARQSAKQQARSYEMERKARELMEEACSELTREVEADQAEVELLRRECLRMREDMEEERRMLQMAEVWREERVQMKLSDAKLALDHKYSQLNRLQEEMEAFLRSKETVSDAIANAKDGRRRHSRSSSSRSPAAASNNAQSVSSPATDLFLAKADDDDASYGGSSADLEYDGGRDSCSWAGTSDRSAPASTSLAANGNNGGGGSGVTTEARSSGASRRSVGKNTALIRRLWRSAITESRSKTAGAPPAAAEQCSSSAGSVNPHTRRRPRGTGTQQQQQQHNTNKQSLKEKRSSRRPEQWTIASQALA